jgi:hypothetical protein
MRFSSIVQAALSATVLAAGAAMAGFSSDAHSGNAASKGTRMVATEILGDNSIYGRDEYIQWHLGAPCDPTVFHRPRPKRIAYRERQVIGGYLWTTTYRWFDCRGRVQRRPHRLQG